MRPALALLVLLLPAAARAEIPACIDAARLVWPDDAEIVRLISFSQSYCAIAAWPVAGPEAYVVATARDETLSVGVVITAPGRPPALLARGQAEVLTMESVHTPLLEIDPRPLGPRQPAIGVRLSNSYTSTGRSTSTEALQVFVRQGGTLAPVFAGYLRVAHSETGPCARNRRATCRTGWDRRWTIAPAAAPAGRMPDLIVRDARNGAVIGRHRWRRDGYEPPISDRTPMPSPG